LAKQNERDINSGIGLVAIGSRKQKSREGKKRHDSSKLS